MLNNVYIIVIVFIFSCKSPNRFNETSNSVSDKVFVALQGLEEIAIMDVETDEIITIKISHEEINCFTITKQTNCEANGCMWHEPTEDDQFSAHCMSHSNSDGSDQLHSPHFISIDYINRYFFITTMMSGWIRQYNLDNLSIKDSIYVGDSPALMVLDEINKLLYVSRMMLMSTGGHNHGAQTSLIQIVDYSDPTTLQIKGNGLDASILGPHAIAINSIGSELYTSTFEGDWLLKFNLIDNTRFEIPLEVGFTENINDAYPPKRMKPIQSILVEDRLLFLTCSAGVNYEFNEESGGYFNNEIPGQLHLWNVENDNIIKKDTIQFDWNSRPWHLVKSPIENKVFVVLKGEDYDIYPDSDGVACISFTSESLITDKVIRHEKFKELHGIDISDDGNRLYVSGFVDGKLHIIDAKSCTYIKSIYLGPEILTQATGVKFYNSHK